MPRIKKCPDCSHFIGCECFDGKTCDEYENEKSLMVWNVYNHDINNGKIRIYNVFKHSSFNQDIQNLLKENLSYNEFAEKLNRVAQYYFWSKAECEIVITSWVPHIDNEELDRLNAEREKRRTYRYCVNLDVGEKVDIYDQLHLNWEQFVKYVYSFKKN